MCIMPLCLLQNPETVQLSDSDFDEIILHYDQYMRLARASWLKAKFGELKIPKDLFVAVVDAEITPPLLDRWYRRGGMNYVYYACKVLFNGGLDVDCRGIREIQEEISRC